MVPAAAHAYLPPGFVGISPQNGGTAKDYELMREAGVHSVRLPLNWSAVEPENPAFSERELGRLRPRGAAGGANAGSRSSPSSPARPNGSRRRAIDLPVATAWQRRAWASFVRAAVRRYGPEGAFWREEDPRPALPADQALGDLERGEHRHLRQPTRTEALRGADPDRRPGHPPRSPRLEGDRRRPLRPAAADPAQHRLRRLPLPPLPGRQREAVLRRRRPAPLRRRRAGDGGAAAQPAADHAPPRRRRARRST